MKLFCEDGHLSIEGLQALVGEELDEEKRLEAAEHLDFCDRCVERYSELLTGDLLLAPPAEVAPPVMAKIRSKTRTVIFSRFTRVAVAAVMALVLWNGMLLGNEGLISRSAEWVNSHPREGISISRAIDNWGSGFNQLISGLNSWFNSGVQGMTGAHHNP